MLEQDHDEATAGDFAAIDPPTFEEIETTEARLETIIREADEEAAYLATELKRRKGIAKATRAALKILREGDSECDSE